MPHVSSEMEIDVVICDFALIDFRELLLPVFLEYQLIE
jgi:hypothetical protein